MYEAGKRNEYIFIQEKTTKKNDFGELVETWINKHEVFASVKYKTGSEKFISDQKTSITRVLFHVLYRENLTVENRIIWNDLIYDITDIKRAGIKSRAFLEIEAIATSKKYIL